MSSGLLDFFLSLNLPSLTGFLDPSSYDEKIELDVPGNSFRYLYIAEGKDNVPVKEGCLSDFIAHMLAKNVHPDDARDYMAMMDTSTIFSRMENSRIPGALDLTYRARTKDGHWHWMEQFLVGTPRHGLPEGKIYCYVFDIQYRKDREADGSETESGAERRDSLTGLLLQKDFLARSDALLRKTDKLWIMAAIDIENFKMFNEWYGADVGDHVLRHIGAGLNSLAVETGGLAGYLGLDDFSLLVPAGSVSMDDVYAIIYEDIVRYGVSLGFMPAIGTAVSGSNVSALNLYDRAALACKHAKDSFKERISAYVPAMSSQTAEDYRILSDFQQALQAGEISFHLQPQCRASTGQIVGAESLARWRKADGAMVRPAVFVPVLEKHGFIPDLDRFIWEAVCRWMHGVKQRGLPLLPISLNVSQVDIFSLNVPDIFSELTKTYDLPNSAVKIEITESACGDDTRQVHEAVLELRRRGFSVLMDDFGSGYSSLNMLSETNFDVIKLDAQFLAPENVGRRKGMHILESVVNMAKTIGVPIIVEGVETEAQRDYLQSLGCRYVQGYFFYKPMSPEEFEALLQQPEKLDENGFQLVQNEQFRVREFLIDSVYSDSMLNSILGPVAIYEWDEARGKVDIARYNEQFYEAVGVPDFLDRLEDIGQYMPLTDAKNLNDTLLKACGDRLNGASGTFSFNRIDGGSSCFLIHFFYLNEKEGKKRFFGSARDISALRDTISHTRLLSKFFSDCIIFLLHRRGQYRLQVVAEGFDPKTHASRELLQQDLNDGSFQKRVLPEDRPRLKALFQAAVEKGESFTTDFGIVSRSTGKPVRLFLKCDCVDDPNSDVRCIIVLADTPARK